MPNNDKPSATRDACAARLKSRAVLLTAVALTTLALLSRGAYSLYSASAVDIAVPDFVEVLFSYLSDALVSLRIALSLTFICCAVYSAHNAEIKSVKPKTAVVTACVCSLVDYAARFLIDLFSSAISGNEITALIWLALNYALEIILFLIAYAVSVMMSVRMSESDSVMKKRRYSVSRALLILAAVYSSVYILSEIYYCVDFFLSYVNITGAEYASVVASFLRIIVLRFGLVAVMCPVFTGFYSRKDRIRY